MCVSVWECARMQVLAEDEGALDPLELELEAIVSCWMWFLCEGNVSA